MPSSGRRPRKYYRDAMRDGFTPSQGAYPFTGIMPRIEPAMKEALSREEVERFRGLRPRRGTMRYHAWTLAA